MRFLTLPFLIVFYISGSLYFKNSAAADGEITDTNSKVKLKTNATVPDIASILSNVNQQEKTAGLQQAIKYYENFLSKHPEDIDILQQLGKLYSWTSKIDLAIVTYQSAIRLDNKAVNLKTDLARIYRWSRRFPETVRLYKEVLETHPNEHHALKGLSITYLMMGDYSNAKILLDKALTIYPKDAELHKEKGVLYARQQQFHSAITILKKSIELSPDMIDAHITLGDVYYWSKHYQKSLDVYNKALTLNPNSHEIHLMIAKIYRKLNNLPIAEEHAITALRLKPASSTAQKLLHQINQEQKLLLYEYSIHYLELFAIVFVIVLIFIGYWKNRHIFYHRHRFMARIIQIGLPATLIFSIAIFVSENQLKQWLDIETSESIASSLVLILLGLVYLVQMLYTGHGKKHQQDNVILAIGAHPDDIELGCGGFILKAKNNNAKVYGLTLSKGERGTHKIDQREKEANRSAFFLELDGYWMLDFDDTHLQEKTNELKEAIEEIINKISPTTVLTHNAYDSHGDHRAVFTATKEAARHVPTILCYESVSTPENFKPNYYVDITDYLSEMLRAIRLHKTQNGKTYMNTELLKGRAAHRGIQCGVPYASAFKVYRIID